MPGHQETSARIIRVSKRMKPNESSIAPSRTRPARWSAVSNAALLLISKPSSASKSVSPGQWRPLAGGQTEAPLRGFEPRFPD